MTEYHKIDSIFKRDQNTKRIIVGSYSNDVFAYLAKNDWVFTEKVDGTNIRVMIHPVITGGEIIFGGRTDAASIPAPLVARLQQRFLSQRDVLNEMFPEGAILYGEGYGAKIQKGGGNYRQDQDFVLFDVLVGHWWLEHDNVLGIGTKLGLDVVPIIGRGNLFDAVAMVREGGFGSVWGDFVAEGIVARPAVELKTRSGQRIITKIKCKDFADLERVAT